MSAKTAQWIVVLAAIVAANRVPAVGNVVGRAT